MPKKMVKLVFPQNLIKEPLTFKMAIKYNIVPNIRRAKITEKVGEMVLELEGTKENLQKAIKYLEKREVKVDEIVGDIVE